MTLLVARDALTVEGSDAARYLQGQLSNDVAGLAVGGSCWSFLLEPTGKLGYLVRVRRVASDSFVLDADAGFGSLVDARLRRFLIRTKATLVAGHVVVDLDAGGDGVTLVGWSDAQPHRLADEPLPAGAVMGSHEEIERRRLPAGWPGPAELLEGTIPGETGLVSLTASFTKGCYTGQELVARVDSRGNNVPRLLHRVHSASPLAVGAVLKRDGVVVATVTSAVGSDALAYVQRGTGVGDALECGGVPVEIATLR